MGLTECHDPVHPLTRTEDAEWRRRQFHSLGTLNNGVIVGSETGFDWSLPECDYFEGTMSTVTWAFAPSELSILSSQSKVTPTALFNRVGFRRATPNPFLGTRVW